LRCAIATNTKPAQKEVTDDVDFLRERLGQLCRRWAARQEICRPASPTGLGMSVNLKDRGPQDVLEST
jgi:hypothetical protein